MLFFLLKFNPESLSIYIFDTTERLNHYGNHHHGHINNLRSITVKKGVCPCQPMAAKNSSI